MAKKSIFGFFVSLGAKYPCDLRSTSSVKRFLCANFGFRNEDLFVSLKERKRKLSLEKETSCDSLHKKWLWYVHGQLVCNFY